jgi:predicted phage terminase large subunit-like protein
MSNLNVALLPWQQNVFKDPARFKIIAAGRRTGKSRLAAWTLIIEALQTEKGHVWYVAPTQGQARDIMWSTLLELGHTVIKGSHVNNMQITLVNGAMISLKGADRPETMRGVSLKYLVMDEYADMKPQVFEQILRPALADQKGRAMFIGTPMGRNHFYELYRLGDSGKDKDYKAWHFTSFDNPLLDPAEIEAAKGSMSSFAFRQEFMASFEASQSEIFKEEWIKVSDEEPDEGNYFMAVDLCGFSDSSQTNKSKNSKLDETAIAIVKVNTKGWWVADILHGRWDVRETAVRILKAAKDYRVSCVGIEKGALKNAVMPYMHDLMRRNGFYPRIEELTHGNKKKADRIVWSLQGRFEHGRIVLNEGDWNYQFMDQLMQFPDTKTHDDLIDALSYIDQIQTANWNQNLDEEEFEVLDQVAGY